MAAGPEVGEARGEGVEALVGPRRAAEGAGDVGRAARAAAAKLHERLRRQPGQLELLAGGGDGADAERGAVCEEPAEELGVLGSCGGPEGEDGADMGMGIGSFGLREAWNSEERLVYMRRS